MIRPVALVLTLLLLAAIFVVAMAGEGGLDWGPAQAYFSPALTSQKMPCEPGWTEAPRTPVVPIDDIEVEWYSHFLRAAQEPSLYLASREPGAGQRQIFRFTLLRSFQRPLFVRVEVLPDGRMRMTAKRLTGRGGFGPGRIGNRIDRWLSPTEAGRLRHVVVDSGVLAAPAPGCDGGADGSRWILEANDHGQYRYLNRWTPKTGPVREAGVVMVGLTGWDLDERRRD